MVFDLDLATSLSVVFTVCMENKGKDGKQVCFCRNREVCVCVSVLYSFSISVVNVVPNDSQG